MAGSGLSGMPCRLAGVRKDRVMWDWRSESKDRGDGPSLFQRCRAATPGQKGGGVLPVGQGRGAAGRADPSQWVTASVHP